MDEPQGSKDERPSESEPLSPPAEPPRPDKKRSAPLADAEGDGQSAGAAPEAPAQEPSAPTAADEPGPQPDTEDRAVEPAADSAPSPEAEREPSRDEPGPNADEVRRELQRKIGRCELLTEIAHGGMATVYLGRWRGAGGFAKTVAVKALHPQYARDPDFVNMFLDEARVVASIRHPNVMPTIDLVDEGGELFIVMDYVEGVTLAHLLRELQERSERIPLDITLTIVAGVLRGLHAAHEATNEDGEPMGVIHRDVSPENILVGADGFARLIDFGVARAAGRLSSTKDGHIKGKMSYLAPEQVQGIELNRQADVFAASIVLWQSLTGRKLFEASNVVEMAHMLVHTAIKPPGRLVRGLPSELDDIVVRGLARSLSKRWSTAEEMADAIEAVGGLASHAEVGRWVRRVAAKRLKRNRSAVRAVKGEAPEPADQGADGAPSHVSTTGHTPATYTPTAPKPFPVAATGALAGVVVLALLIWGVQQCGDETLNQGPASRTAATAVAPRTAAVAPEPEPDVEQAAAGDTAGPSGAAVAAAGDGVGERPGEEADAGADAAVASSKADASTPAGRPTVGGGKLPTAPRGSPSGFTPPGI